MIAGESAHRRPPLYDTPSARGSELQPQRELNVTLASSDRAGDLSEVPILPIVVGSRELRRIEQVEALEAELQLNSFLDRKILEERQIQGLSRRSGVGLQPQVAAGQRRRRAHRAGIEPQIRSSAARWR